MQSTSFSMPEYDEFQWASDREKAHPYNLESIKYKSPTLPLHFDKKYLPKNLCEPELLNASRCLLLENVQETSKELMCAFELSQFQVCRRQRDIRILNSIKTWQTKHFQGLDKQNKGMYQMGMNRKMSRLQQQFQRQPSTIKGIEKAKQLQAEIKQLKWRLGYISPLDK